MRIWLMINNRVVLLPPHYSSVGLRFQPIQSLNLSIIFIKLLIYQILKQIIILPDDRAFSCLKFCFFYCQLFFSQCIFGSKPMIQSQKQPKIEYVQLLFLFSNAFFHASQTFVPHLNPNFHNHIVDLFDIPDQIIYFILKYGPVFFILYGRTQRFHVQIFHFVFYFLLQIRFIFQKNVCFFLNKQFNHQLKFMRLFQFFIEWHYFHFCLEFNFEETVSSLWQHKRRTSNCVNFIELGFLQQEQQMGVCTSSKIKYNKICLIKISKFID